MDINFTFEFQIEQYLPYYIKTTLMIKKLYLTIAAIALLTAAGFAEEPVITMTTIKKNASLWIALSGISGSSVTVDFGTGGTVTQTLTDESTFTTFKSPSNLTGDATEIKIYGEGITSLQATWIDLVALDVSKDTDLKWLFCSGNLLTSLDVSQNANLKELYCDGNKLSSLHVNESSTFYYLYCENNNLDIATLPIPRNNFSFFKYAPQNAVSLPKTNIAVGESIDLSRFSTVKDASGVPTQTSYVWKTITGETLVEGTDYTVNAGVFTFIRNLGDYVFCEMSNQVFPQFINEKVLTTSTVLVGEQVQSVVVTLTTNVNRNSFAISLYGYAGIPVTVDFGALGKVTKKLEGDDRWVEFACPVAPTKGSTTKVTVAGSGITGVNIPYGWYSSSDSFQPEVTLDVSQALSLKTLSCSNNYLKELDLSHNLKLVSLSCDNNKLSSLDVSQNVALNELYCDNNLLSSLDISKNAVLKNVNCYNNQLISLKVNGNSTFRSLRCFNNNLDITTLLIPSSKIDDYSYVPQSAVALPKVKYAVGESVNLSRFLTVKDANGLAKPTVFTWKTVAGEALVAGTDFTVTDGVFTLLRDLGNYIYCEISNPVFPEFTGKDILATSAALMGIDAQPLVTTLSTNKYDYPSSIELSGYAGIPVTVDFGIHGKVTKVLEGDGKGVVFTSPGISGGGITVINVFGNGVTGVSIPWQSINLLEEEPKVTIDVSKNIALKRLVCRGWYLTSLDVSKNSNLEALDCYNNRLTNLDLSKNKLLTSLDCGYNKLLSLDISQNGSLKDMDCSNNRLISLILNGTVEYNSINCSNNLLNYTSLALPTSRIERYTYEPQYSIPQQKPMIALGETVDLSRFLTVKDASNVEHPTTFTWKKHTGELLVEGTNFTQSGGVFTLKQEGLAYCELSNAAFPKLAGENILKTANVLVGEQPFAFSMTTIKKGTFSFSLGGAIGSPITVKYSNGVTLTKSIEEFDGTFTCPAELTADATDVKVYGSGIKSINVGMFQGLSSIDVSQLASLEELYCRENKLTTLDVSKNLALRSLTCYNNQLNSISLNRDNKFEHLSIEWNRLTFATLPQLNNQWENTRYSFQYNMVLPKASYAVGEAIDLSSQLSAKDVDGNVQTTIYSWYNSKNEMLSPINDYTESNGVFTFKRAIADKVYCHMSNHAYPDFDKNMYDWFKTVPVSIGATGISDGTSDAVKVYVSSGTLVVEGLRGGEAISVVNMLGSVVHQSVAGGSTVTIPLPVHGLYVVRVGTSAHRIAW